MILDDTKAVSELLTEAGLEFIIVGGAILEADYHVGTMDVDIAVSLLTYPKAVAVLVAHRRVRNVEDLGHITGCEVLVGTRWVDVEIIPPQMFSGTREPDEFYEYIRRYRSHSSEIGRIVDPEVVWYMRLATLHWRVYVQKILRDVRAGVPMDLLKKVQEIADRFGIGEVMVERIAATRQMLEISERR